MNEIITDNVRGALKVNGSLDRQYFTSWREFIEALPNLLSVEIPSSITNVVVSAGEPGDDDGDKLWVRKDSAGGFLGLYLFQRGKWRRFFNSAPNEVHWFGGDSNHPEEGFVVIDDEDAVFTSYVVTSLKVKYIPKELGDGYVYYAARFESF